MKLYRKNSPFLILAILLTTIGITWLATSAQAQNATAPAEAPKAESQEPASEASSEEGSSAEALDTGDTAWMITATALVLFMTLPGLALF